MSSKKFKLSLLGTVITAVLAGCSSVPKDALMLSADSIKDRQIQTRIFETRDKETMLTAATAVLQDLGFGMDDSDADLGVVIGSKVRDATSGGQIAGVIFLALLGVDGSASLDSHQTIKVSMVMRSLRDKNEQKISYAGFSKSERDSLRKSIEDTIFRSLPKDISRNNIDKLARAASTKSIELLDSDITKRIANNEFSGNSSVRVTFQRVIYNAQGKVTKAEQINDQKIYQQFFEKLSKSVFLEAQSL